MNAYKRLLEAGSLAPYKGEIVMIMGGRVYAHGTIRELLPVIKEADENPHAVFYLSSVR